MTHKPRGGARPGAGRKRSDKRNVTIALSPEQIAAAESEAGKVAPGVRAIIDAHIRRKVDATGEKE